MASQIIWQWAFDNEPSENGLYAVHIVHKIQAGIEIEAQYYKDGWERPNGIVGFAGPFSNEEEVEKWVRKNYTILIY